MDGHRHHPEEEIKQCFMCTYDPCREAARPSQTAPPLVHRHRQMIQHGVPTSLTESHVTLNPLIASEY